MSPWFLAALASLVTGTLVWMWGRAQRLELEAKNRRLKQQLDEAVAAANAVIEDTISDRGINTQAVAAIASALHDVREGPHGLHRGLLDELAKLKGTAALRPEETGVEDLFGAADPDDWAINAAQQSSELHMVTSQASELCMTVEQALTHAVDHLTEVRSEFLPAASELRERLTRADEASGYLRSSRDLLTRMQERATEVTELSTTVLNEAEAGYGAVHATIDEIEEMKKFTAELERQIHSLGEQVEGIGNVVRIIHEIAQKTNLLSLNASIVAAQAGEHGQAFGVLAEEIKALADRTRASTEEITYQVASIRGENAQAVEGVGIAARAIEKGFDVALSAGDALARIREVARKAQRQTQSIARTAGRQDARDIVLAAEMVGTNSDDVLRKVESLVTAMTRVGTDLDTTTMHAQQLKKFVSTAAMGKQRESETFGRLTQAFAELLKARLQMANELGHAVRAGELLDAKLDAMQRQTRELVKPS